MGPGIVSFWTIRVWVWVWVSPLGQVWVWVWVGVSPPWSQVSFSFDPGYGYGYGCHHGTMYCFLSNQQGMAIGMGMEMDITMGPGIVSFWPMVWVWLWVWVLPRDQVLRTRPMIHSWDLGSPSIKGNLPRRSARKLWTMAFHWNRQFPLKKDHLHASLPIVASYW